MSMYIKFEHDSSFAPVQDTFCMVLCVIIPSNVVLEDHSSGGRWKLTEAHRKYVRRNVYLFNLSLSGTEHFTK